MKEPLWLSKALILAVHDRLLADCGDQSPWRQTASLLLNSKRNSWMRIDYC